MRFTRRHYNPLPVIKPISIPATVGNLVCPIEAVNIAVMHGLTCHHHMLHLLVWGAFLHSLAVAG